MKFAIFMTHSCRVCCKGYRQLSYGGMYIIIELYCTRVTGATMILSLLLLLLLLLCNNISDSYITPHQNYLVYLLWFVQIRILFLITHFVWHIIHNIIRYGYE